MGLDHLCESAVGAATSDAPFAWRIRAPAATPHVPSRVERCRKLVLRAWSELAGMKLTEALATVEAIEVECKPLPLPAAGLDCALLHAASVALNDHAEAAAHLVENALEAHEGGGAHPAASFLLRLGHWKARRLDAFSQVSCPVSHVAVRPREGLWAVLHLSMEASVEAEQLRLASAARLATEALELATACRGSDVASGRLAATLRARVLYEQNDVAAADRLVRDRLVLSGAQGGVEAALGAYIVGAKIAAAQGQLPFAILLLCEAERLGEERGWPRLVAASCAERVRLLVEEGRTSEAEACTTRLAQLPARTACEANDYHVARHLAVSRARLELSRGNGAQVVCTLRRLVAESMRRREFHVAVELMVLLACALRAAGDEQEAAAEAVHAIQRGAAAGLYRTFLDGAETSRELLHWLYERADATGAVGELRPYLRNLLLGFRDRREQPATARTRHRSGDSLSPRERHIVKLMSHGLSNKRIARQLSIAPETVKSHAKHILLKLAAQTRVEAVSRALSLGMI